VRLADDYRRIDALLEARARDYPRRVEPVWSELLAAIDALAARLREETEPVEASLPGFYEHPIFVVGHRKTGTTLVQELLDGHPQLSVLPGESNHFQTFSPRFTRTPEVGPEAQRWWLLRLVTPSGIPPFWALGKPWEEDADPYAAFTSRLLGLAAANPGRDFLGMAAVALAPGERIAWVEKTPGHEHRLEHIIAAYPEARFVHVVRDPRSVAAAIVRLDRATHRPTDLVDVGLTIRRSFEAAERNRCERYLVLPYEDLVKDPEPVMRRIADFAGIDWADSLLTPTVGGVGATSNSAWSSRKVTGEIEGRRLDLWRDEVGDRQAGLIAAAAGSAARRHGYELPRPGPRERAAVATRRARVALASRRRPSLPTRARTY
jgi:sulfotransferase family protein